MRHFFATTLFSLLAASSPVDKRGFHPVNCDYGLTPTWDDCDGTRDILLNAAGPGGSLSCPGGKSNALYATNGDCEMSLIWFDCAVGPDIPYNQIGLGWSAITVCAPDAGGYLDTGEGWKIDIRAPDLGRRINATSASAISKRQTGDPSSDDSWTTIQINRNVRRHDLAQRVDEGALPAQSTLTLTESNSKNYEVTASVDVSAGFFDLFEASVGFSGSYGQTWSNSVSQGIYVDCDEGEVGTVSFVPYYDEYVGSFNSDPYNFVTFANPLTISDKLIDGQFEVTCYAELARVPAPPE